MGKIGLNLDNTTDPIILIAEKVNELVNGLNQLRSEFDAQLEKMQDKETKKKLKEAFEASPEELGKAAVRAINTIANPIVGYITDYYGSLLCIECSSTENSGIPVTLDSTLASNPCTNCGVILKHRFCAPNLEKPKNGNYL